MSLIPKLMLLTNGLINLKLSLTAAEFPILLLISIEATLKQAFLLKENKLAWMMYFEIRTQDR